MNPHKIILRGFRTGHLLIDADTGELYKNGNLCKRLRPQVLKVLISLLARAGEVVKREELVGLLWSGSAGEPEGGLKKVIAWLREDLEDSADHPRYIEVVPRVGIRFIAPVEKPDIGSSPSTQIPIAEPGISDAALLLVVGPDIASRRMKNVLAKLLRECRKLSRSETYDQIISVAESEVAKGREEASNSPSQTERYITMAVADGMENMLAEFTLRTAKSHKSAPLQLFSQVIDEWS